MIEGFATQTLLVLGILIFIAGFMDSIAGGGGLITLPSYLNAGLKTDLLLGTNKLSSTFGTLAAALRYRKEIQLPKTRIAMLVLLAVIGSAMGAKFITSLPREAVKYLLIAIIPSAAFFMLSKKNFGLTDLSHEQNSKNIFLKSAAISFSISFYDGFFGPGTGSFLAVAFTSFCGYGLLRSTALSKLLNFSSNISALTTFLILGRVHLKLGLMMALIGITGNFLGSSLALKKGSAVIRPLLFIVANALLIKIIYGMIK